MQTIKLGEILQLKYGKPLPNSVRKTDGIYPVYGANGVKDRSDNFYFDRPSIIVGRKGSAGELTLTDTKFWPLDVTYFVTFNESKYDLKYIFYLLTYLNLPMLAKGVKPGINRNEVYSIKIHDPGSVENQTRTVDKLDKTFMGIDRVRLNIDQNIINADKLFESLLKKEFEKELDKFEHEELGNIFTFKNGRSFKKEEWKKTGLPIIRIQNLKSTESNFNYYDGDYSSNIVINEGDLLFSWSGTVGTSFGPHIWNGPQALLNQHIFKLNKLIEIDEQYVYFALKLITSEIEKRTHGAGGLVHVTKPTLQRFRIPLPPPKDQTEIADYLRTIEQKTKNLQGSYKQKLDKLTGLKRAILKQAFEGKL